MVIEITRLWMPLVARYWTIFCRSNFAVPTPFETVQFVLLRSLFEETSMPAMPVMRTLDPSTCETLRPGTRT